MNQTISRFFVSIILIFFCTVVTAQQKKSADSAKSIISRHHTLFLQPPHVIPSAVSVDAPLLGNGNISAAISGIPERQVYHLAKNNFWRLKSSYNEAFPAIVGKLIIEMPSLKNAGYKIEQDLYSAITTSSFSNKQNAVSIQSFVAATANLLLLEITNNGKTDLPITVSLLLPQPEDFEDQSNKNILPSTMANGEKDGVSWISRTFDKDMDIITKAACAIKLSTDGKNNNILKPGKKLYVTCALSGNFESNDCPETAIGTANTFNTDALRSIKKSHAAWWTVFWNKSWIQIPDKAIERLYYVSQYTLASCSRNKDFPASIFGSWITMERPSWNGDYHLNYNHMAPYYGLYSSNHIEQADPYSAPLLAFIERGKYYSQKITGIADGIMLPVGIGPMGIETTRKTERMQELDPDFIKEGFTEDEGLFFGQKSNAAYAVVNMSMQFYYTYDSNFAAKVYPFVKSVATFWEGYLKEENGAYVILNDAIHEGTLGDKNGILSLGLVPMVMQTAIDMGRLLNVDSGRYAKWQDILNRLSTYPLQNRNGKEVFRYTSKGTDWVDGNTLGIQHIYPAGQINLDSKQQWVTAAENTIMEMGRWLDMNGSNSFFPAAVRVGYNPDTILYYLGKYVQHTYPNGFQLNNPHGIENCSTVPNTINEMLCMSNGGIIRLFAVWPKEKDAAFHTLRAEGAFLVSSRLQSGNLSFVHIYSEKGRECILRNPWKDKKVIIKSSGEKIVTLSGSTLRFPTLPGREYILEAF